MDQGDIRTHHPMGAFADYEGCDSTDKPSSTAPETYNFAVYYTQGGGLARLSGQSDTYVFVEAPSPEMGLGVGDFVPREWGLAPANLLAHEEALEERWND